MAVPNFATLQDIREEAGRQHTKLSESLGTGNGAKTVFDIPRMPVDSNYSDTLTVADVKAYVGGSSVAVSAISQADKTVTLAVAPANNAVVTLDYQFSNLSDDIVEDRRAEAQGALKTKVQSYIDWDSLDAQGGEEPYPIEFSTVVRLWAGGLILIRDHGTSADTNLSSKDGYEKIRLAKTMINDYISDIRDDTTSKSVTSPNLKTDGNIFSRDTQLGSAEVGSSQKFFNKNW